MQCCFQTHHAARHQRRNFAQAVTKPHPGSGVLNIEKFVEQLQLRLLHRQDQRHGIGICIQIRFLPLLDTLHQVDLSRQQAARNFRALPQKPLHHRPIRPMRQ